MIEYICIEDEEELKDNISDSGSKVVHMKREVKDVYKRQQQDRECLAAC